MSWKKTRIRIWIQQVGLDAAALVHYPNMEKIQIPGQFEAVRSEICQNQGFLLGVTFSNEAGGTCNWNKWVEKKQAFEFELSRQDCN